MKLRCELQGRGVTQFVLYPLVKTLLIFYFISITIFCPLKSIGLEYTIHFNRVNMEHGLSQNTVMRIKQDPRGFMWFGTEFELNRYDAKKILVGRIGYLEWSGEPAR